MKMNFKKIKPKGVETKGKEKKYYPHLRISLDDLPEAKEWKIGETYQVAFELEQTGMVKDEYTNEASFDIKGVHIIDDHIKCVKNAGNKK